MIKFVLNKVPRKYIQKVANITVPLLSPFLWGRKIKCPICNGSFRKLLSYGYVTTRKNALCPRCLGLERHRMVWYYLCNERGMFEEGNTVLHVAPEYPFINRFEKILSKKSGTYITADIESPLAKVKMNIENIQFGDNYFDVVFCNHVLEHVDDDIKAMRELYRVLKPGGWGILLSPVDYSLTHTYQDSSITDSEQRKIHFGQHDHQRVYGLDYAQRLSSVGFTVKEVDYSSVLPKEVLAKMAFSSEILYIVEK